MARRLVSDYMWASGSVARVDTTRRVALADVMAARRALQEPPTLTAIFVKAFALTAAEIPELRRVYIRWPWPHLHEYGDSTVSIMQERQIEGDTGLLPLRVRGPDALSLRELDDAIRAQAATPIEASNFHRRLLAITRCPLLVRRMLWGIALNVPRLRRHLLGTYAVSNVARWQGELGRTRSPVPCLLSYGPLDDAGHLRVRLNFDHRVFDGAVAARVLARLDEVLNASILAELRAQRPAG